MRMRAITLPRRPPSMTRPSARVKKKVWLIGPPASSARWINHACSPNCEAYEEEGRVYIHALHPIEAGQELNYNYALIYDERHTPALKKLFECRCGTPGCTGTMLAPKKRSRKKA